MRDLLLFTAIAFGASATAVAEDHYSPPPIGTMVTWSFGNESDRETRISEVVATGEDFVIYLSDLRLDAESAASYIVEFSGLHVVSCTADMPGENERQRLASAWPLTPGNTVELEGDANATYTIGQQTRHTLNAGDGPMDVRQIKASYGAVENDITLSLNWHMPVAIQWPDGTGDKALEVLPPASETGPKSELRDAVGNCADLL